MSDEDVTKKPEEEAEEEKIAISDKDRDSLYVLPLSALELETKALRTSDQEQSPSQCCGVVPRRGYRQWSA